MVRTNIGPIRLAVKLYQHDLNQDSSYDVNRLQTKDLSATVMPRLMSDDLSERVRLRLREEMGRKKLSQQDLADLIQWTQSRVAQKLTGRTPITLEELSALCFGVGLSLVEAVRDHGLEFCAQMTPSELRVHQRVRELPPAMVDALGQFLGIRMMRQEKRRATPLPKKK